ncbi:MAG TPA: hypothetical protein VFU89_03895 [Rhabdochlamydiaceae bacterium]|nr:hypothetical protein [Rhabdochlamydiaceae bacterium]
MSSSAVIQKPIDSFTLFQELSPELRLPIIKCRADLIISLIVNRAVFSNEDIKNGGKELSTLSLVCIEFENSSSKQRADIKMIFTLYNKYSVYNKIYLEPGCYYEPDKEEGKMVPCGNPQLLDLVSAGHPYRMFAWSSFKEFTNEQYQDMEQITRLMPRSLLCNIGQLRARAFVTPFIMACKNPNVPVKAVEFLLQKGANPNSIFSLSEDKVHILTDLRNFNKDRYVQLKPILEKYGAVEEVFTEFDSYVYGDRRVWQSQKNDLY